MSRFVVLVEICFGSMVSCAVADGDSGNQPIRKISPNEAIARIEQLGGRIRPLKGNSRFREIDFHLRGKKLKDKDLELLQSVPNVALLNLKNTQVTGKGLCHLERIRDLRWLHLEQTRITDEGTESLSRLENLEYLNLFDTDVSDKTLTHLSKLKRLRKLYVWKTRVTDQGIKRLSQQLPWLKIIRGVDLSKLPSTPPPPTPKQDLVKLPFLKVEGDKPPRSKLGENIAIHFENHLEISVKVYWVGYDGQLKLYAQLEPGRSRERNTYSDASWLITNLDDEPIGYFRTGTDECRAVISTK